MLASVQLNLPSRYPTALQTCARRPEYTWERFQIARFWLAFASAEDRQRALSRNGAYLVRGFLGRHLKAAAALRSAPGRLPDVLSQPATHACIKCHVLQGTRRVVMRTALPRDFTSAVFNPLAMSSRGRYLLVEGLSTSSTSGEQHFAVNENRLLLPKVAEGAIWRRMAILRQNILHYQPI